MQEAWKDTAALLVSELPAKRVKNEECVREKKIIVWDKPCKMLFCIIVKLHKRCNIFSLFSVSTSKTILR